MALLEAAELEQMLRDSGGVDVSLGGVTTSGHLRNATPLLGELAQARGARRSVVIPSGILEGLAQDAEIEVDGTTYTVIDFGTGSDYDTPADGSLTRVLLA